MTRPRIIIAALLLALVLAAAAAGAQRELLPGVTYERVQQSTTHGTLVLHVVRAPRPGGLYTLAPVIANDTVVGRETVTAMQRRLAAGATMVGINADFFEVATGRPSGILMRDSGLVHPPTGGRSSIGITLDGLLDIARVDFFGTWQGTAEKHPLDDLNQAPESNGISLFTSDWGAVTPAVPGATVAVLFPLPLPAPNIDLAAPVMEIRQASTPVAIPPGGAVLVARGAAAQQLRAEAVAGGQVVVSLLLRPEWPNIVAAVGGGPVIVRDGAPVFRANEEFRDGQLAPRVSRSAIGQARDGRLLLVAVDGRSGGSAGVTNWELAQAMVRLGAVTAAGLDSGGSTAMAFDGSLLNTPSDARGERPVADALMLAYQGVYVLPEDVEAGMVEPQTVDAPVALSYKVVRPSLVTATLTAPDGSIALEETTDRLPGTYEVALPPDGQVPLGEDAPAAAPMQGRWRLEVAASDDLGQVSRMTRSVTVNRTVSGLTTEPRRLLVPPGGRDARIVWDQTARGFVTVTVLGRGGAVIRTLAQQRFEPGPAAVTWNGLDRTKKRVPAGVYRVRVVSKNALGVLDVVVKLPVRQVKA